MKRFGRNEDGSVAVEFAVVMSLVLLPFLIGVVDVGRLCATRAVLTRAVREGAIQASRSRDYETTVKEALASAGLSPEKVVVELVAVDGSQGLGSAVAVEARYNLDNFPMLPLADILPGTVRARTVVRHE